MVVADDLAGRVWADHVGFAHADLAPPVRTADLSQRARRRRGAPATGNPDKSAEDQLAARPASLPGLSFGPPAP